MSRKKIPCGKTGYALEYGLKYCQKFLSLNFTSEFTSKWRDKTMYCLQKRLLDVMNQKISCQELEIFAYQTHVPCYKELPYSFCSISSVTDILKIINLIKITDYFKTIPYAIKIVYECVKVKLFY